MGPPGHAKRVSPQLGGEMSIERNANPPPAPFEGAE